MLSEDESLDGISAKLLSRMGKAANGDEMEEDFTMEYSTDGEDSEEEERRSTPQGDPEASTTKRKNIETLSYAKATSANTKFEDFRPQLKNTLICTLQVRVNMLDILHALEKNNFDEEMEGV